VDMANQKKRCALAIPPHMHKVLVEMAARERRTITAEVGVVIESYLRERGWSDLLGALAAGDLPEEPSQA
jgi:hypothetical protein